MFAKAGYVVAHHGAGLANITFCSDTVAIAEIFNETMAPRDCWLRPRYVTTRYRPALGDAGTVVADIDAALDALVVSAT